MLLMTALLSCSCNCFNNCFMLYHVFEHINKLNMCLSTVGCEYGDKASWCATYVRGRGECERPEVAQLCCQRCEPYLNTQPTTTTTTTTTSRLHSSLLTSMQKSFALLRSYSRSNFYIVIRIYCFCAFTF